VARSHYRGTIYGDQAAGVKPLPGAAVRLFDPITGNPWPYPVYPDPVNGAAYALPILTDPVGTLDLWADEPARVAVTITHPSYRGSGGVIDIEPDPAESATDEDVSESVAEHEAKTNPHPQYLTVEEANDLYLTPSQANDAYVNTDGDEMTGPITFLGPPGQTYRSVVLENAEGPSLLVTVYGSPALRVQDGYLLPGYEGGGGYIGSDAERWDRLYADNAYVTGPVNAGSVYATTEVYSPSFNKAGAAVMSQPENDLRYEQLSKKGAANGYVPLDAGAKIPNAYLPDLAITNTFVVVSQAEMLALPAQTGDVAVRLDTSENYILAADPATVLANWTKLAASTIAGNTTVIRREEFTPAAAATTVALAVVPTTILSVTRNGVEQSGAAGHYSVAGVTVTFTDAFVAGERVSIMYEMGASGSLEAQLADALDRIAALEARLDG
jgi:hypothetical protein